MLNAILFPPDGITLDKIKAVRIQHVAELIGPYAYHGIVGHGLMKERFR